MDDGCVRRVARVQGFPGRPMGEIIDHEISQIFLQHNKAVGRYTGDLSICSVSDRATRLAVAVAGAVADHELEKGGGRRVVVLKHGMQGGSSMPYYTMQGLRHHLSDRAWSYTVSMTMPSESDERSLAKRMSMVAITRYHMLLKAWE